MINLLNKSTKNICKLVEKDLVIENLLDLVQCRKDANHAKVQTIIARQYVKYHMVV
jgi:hypothetical protein